MASGLRVVRTTRPDPSITVYPSPLRLALLALGSFALVACGLLPALGGESALAIGVGWFSVAFFGAAGGYLLLRLVRPRAVLALDREGLTDHASGFGVGFVPWPEVVAATPIHIGRQHMVALAVSDPVALRRRFGRVRGYLMRANTALAGGVVHIPTVMLPFGVDELLALIDEFAPDHVRFSSRGRHAASG